MIKDLTDAQIDHLLRTQSYGRLGCSQGEELYIVPLSYVYHGDHLYAHSKEGMKISWMRKQPKVCFQIDEIQNANNWWSIIIWAEYEELTQDPLKTDALRLLEDRFAAFSSSKSVHPNPPSQYMTGFAEKAAQPIFFRLKIISKSGRSERS
jgi:nitroimidazol reductase NimA-like FMN-containing flavoprotein (pyridoxamine 5'-phosphate oxidase superfamily)